MKQLILAITEHLLAQFLGEPFHKIPAQPYGFFVSFLTLVEQWTYCCLIELWNKVDNNLNTIDKDYVKINH